MVAFAIAGAVVGGVIAGIGASKAKDEARRFIEENEARLNLETENAMIEEAFVARDLSLDTQQRLSTLRNLGQVESQSQIETTMSKLRGPFDGREEVRRRLDEFKVGQEMRKQDINRQGDAATPNVGLAIFSGALKGAQMGMAAQGAINSAKAAATQADLADDLRPLLEAQAQAGVDIAGVNMQAANLAFNTAQVLGPLQIQQAQGALALQAEQSKTVGMQQDYVLAQTAALGERMDYSPASFSVMRSALSGLPPARQHFFRPSDDYRPTAQDRLLLGKWGF